MYQRDPMLLEYASHLTGSSLGAQISPRRGMASALEMILMSKRVSECRYLIVRLQDGSGPYAFDAKELDAAATARVAKEPT